MAGNRNIDPEVGKATQFKPGHPPTPGSGRKPGSRPWATVIREMVEDEEYTIKFANGELRKYPAKIITDVMMKKASSGDVQAANWLAKYTIGEKLDVTSLGEKLETPAVYLPKRDADDTELPPVQE